MENILPLKMASTAATGGKAQGLALLLQNDIVVPDGFVVLPKTSGTDVLEAFDLLASPLVAVRSSAQNEDGSQNTWAGQLDSFLHVDRDSLLAKIKACQNSAQSARAQAYGSHANTSAGEIAVIVQQMIPGEISGVTFSAHPITNDPATIYIEACLGIGEALVSGEVTPDSFTVNKQTGAVIDQHIIANTSLSEQHIQNIVEATRKIESLYKKAVDIEWTISGGTLYILQSRPITTLS